jgi:competence ComEA-like helix-hairpin-helix protein
MTQEAPPDDDLENAARNSDRDQVLWSRTQAFAGLLLMIVCWTMAVWTYREWGQTVDNQIPIDLVVDLNEATQAELNLLPGVGEKLASDILKYRDEIGGFRSIDELKNIRGIKEGRLLSLRKHITINRR